MKTRTFLSVLSLVVAAFQGGCSAEAPAAGASGAGGSLSAALVYDVRKFGASGDGKTLDSPAINKAIDSAAAAGGGTVFFPPGTYRSFSIRLKSNICLHLDQAATILA